MTEVAFIGNFGAEFSTENDLLDALNRNGVTVTTIEERDWHQDRARLPDPDGFDFLLWVHTHGWPTSRRGVEQVETWKRAGRPIVGYHLDRWWGLRRQSDVYETPYFRLMDRFYVADPHVERFARAGVKGAVWTPPAVSDRNRLDGQVVIRWSGYEVAFVGNTSDDYHPEHTHRRDLLAQLRRRFGTAFVEIPGAGKPAIRGGELADIYASIPVIVGDSCLVGLDTYWSDRVPETIGRGGFLVHPETYWADQYEPSVHLETWNMGDWAGMETTIRHALAYPRHRGEVAAEGAHHVRTHHLYIHRVERILEDIL